MKNVRLIEVKEDIMADNDAVSKRTKDRLKETNTFLLNLMASPGAGKTSLILKTLETMDPDITIGVMEADIDSTVDAEKVAARGVEAIQIRTGGFCHMDATMVNTGLDNMDLAALDIVILENVGNLVCPAEFDTGAVKNAMILSVPEGDDKPLKYPLMFTVSDIIVINKIDYLAFSDFDLGAFKQRVERLNGRAQIIEVSCKTGEGISEWLDWLKREHSNFTGR